MTRATLRIGNAFSNREKPANEFSARYETKRRDASQGELKNISRERGPKRNLLSMERTRSRQEAGFPAAGWSTAEHRGIQWRMINVVPSFIVSSLRQGGSLGLLPLPILSSSALASKQNETKRNETKRNETNWYRVIARKRRRKRGPTPTT